MRQKLRQRPVIELQLSIDARVQQLQAARIEAPVQACKQLQCERRQHLLATLHPRREYLNLRPCRVARVHLSVRLGVHATQYTAIGDEI
jgi:hypothetical protein